MLSSLRVELFASCAQNPLWFRLRRIGRCKRITSRLESPSTRVRQRLGSVNDWGPSTLVVRQPRRGLRPPAQGCRTRLPWEIAAPFPNPIASFPTPTGVAAPIAQIYPRREKPTAPLISRTQWQAIQYRVCRQGPPWKSLLTPEPSRSQPRWGWTVDAVCLPGNRVRQPWAGGRNPLRG